MSRSMALALGTGGRVKILRRVLDPGSGEEYELEVEELAFSPDGISVTFNRVELVAYHAAIGELLGVSPWGKDQNRSGG